MPAGRDERRRPTADDPPPSAGLARPAAGIPPPVPG